MALGEVYTGTKPFASLNAAVAVGQGTPLDTQNTHTNHSLQVSFTGGATAVVVQLIVSLDGITYTVVATWSSTGGQTNGQMISVSGIPARFVAANLTTLTGGSSPTVTALVASSG